MQDSFSVYVARYMNNSKKIDKITSIGKKYISKQKYQVVSLCSKSASFLDQFRIR